jgi:hypothetical protein
MPRPTARLALGAALVALALAACGGAASTPLPSAATPTPTTAPSATAGTPTPPAPTTVPGGSDRTPAPSPGTFETAWGEAWDALPAGFPVPAGAAPADPGDPTAGPVSGAFVVDLSAEDAVAAQQAGLAAAGYSTEALSGPSEDGALVIDSIGQDPACRVQTIVRPLGGTTMMTVLYGAACPWS